MQSPVMKKSKQRDAILQNLRERTDHPTAEQVYASLKPQIPKLSLGTVYRNLSQLEETGAVAKVSVVGNTERYDGNIAEHYHFSCTECGDVSDVHIPILQDIDSSVEVALGGTVKSHSLIFYGICKKCKKKSLTNEIIVL